MYSLEVYIKSFGGQKGGSSEPPRTPPAYGPEMACCVRGYHVYKDIRVWQQQLGKCLCVAGSQPTRKNFRCKIIFA